AFDPGPLLRKPWTLAALAAVLRNVDVLLANTHELCVLAGTSDLAVAIRRFRARQAGHIVVKRGAAGALWCPADEPEPEEFRGLRIRAVNTVGAGDSFNGALLGALVKGASFAAAIRRANRTAA